jgi:hypothetical protein
MRTPMPALSGSPRVRSVRIIPMPEFSAPLVTAL